MAYQPIENYGVIGDMHSVALVGIDGAIDWLCLPNFDSPSVFAAILDDRKGGSFRIAPADCDVTSKQSYWPDTNVLVTRFFTHESGAELIDFMPVSPPTPDQAKRRTVIRRVTALRGETTLRMDCRPAFNFARDAHEVRLVRGGAVFESRSSKLELLTSVELRVDEGAVLAEFTIREGERVTFILQEMQGDEPCGTCLSDDETEQTFRRTVQYWRGWISQCSYRGRWREAIHRSALALKLLTFEPTGAIVAAPTCSLPEGIGGVRNWDYRYTWIRDSAFTIYAFMRLGFTQEAAQFMDFLSRVCMKPGKDGSLLQIMYGIDGRKELPEETLEHLDGYCGSRPVRIGNDAHGQLQLDIYGELLDAVYLFNKYGAPISYETWRTVERLVDWVCDNWQREDEGVWEIRGGRRHFVYSKLMCWVAVDRGLRLAEKRSFPASRGRWIETRDAIYHEIMEKGWSPELEAFTQAYGSETLDAANLMMPLVFFLSPTDPRLLSTLDAMMRPPPRGGLLSSGLVYRYHVERSPDGLDGDEGTFNICTFWLAEALARAGRFDVRRLEESRLLFEHMLGFANHVGLYAEETGHRGEALGNFPQAFTHLALISAAFNLDRALGGGEGRA
jgi:GH15 family glucan-1,4-alpha-glucosidase